MNKLMIALSIAFAFSCSAMAADTTKAKKETSAGPTKESREKMAVAHEKLAQCLRSDKSMEDCHEQMHEQCQEMKKDGGGCPMMGKMGKGMKKHHMHMDHDAEKSEKEE